MTPEEMRALLYGECPLWYHHFLPMDEPWVRDCISAIHGSRAIVIEDTSSGASIDDIMVTHIIETAQSRHSNILVDEYFRQPIRNVISTYRLSKEILHKISFFASHTDQKLYGAKPSLVVLMSLRSGDIDEERMADRILRLRQFNPHSQFIVCGDIRLPTVLTRDCTRDWDRIAILTGSEHGLLSDPDIRERFLDK